jgi:hypothetical protein
MARYKKYTQTLTCACGNIGEVVFEEAENPVYHGDESRVVSVSGFTIKTNELGKQEAECDSCNKCLPL